jgi:hypothetical protein
MLENLIILVIRLFHWEAISTQYWNTADSNNAFYYIAIFAGDVCFRNTVLQKKFVRLENVQNKRHES